MVFDVVPLINKDDFIISTHEQSRLLPEGV